MKKCTKITILILALSLAVAGFVLVSFAEDGADLPAFVVYGADGNPTDVFGETFEDLCTAVDNLENGDTVVLNSDIDAFSPLMIDSNEESPRHIGINLNGHKLSAKKKINMGLISVGSYTTVDVYSSAPGAVLYSADTVQSNMGGSIFNVREKDAVLNVGEFTKDGVTYPGSNISTYSAALIDIVTDGAIYVCEPGCRFNVNGGSYYSIVSDYSGFIIPRGGEIIMSISNANIISMESKAPINSLGVKTVLNLTNCRIFQYQSQPINLFNAALGTINMENCITSYAVKSSQSEKGNGVLHLKGKNVFAIAADGDYYSELIADFSNRAAVTTYADFELVGGGSTLSYYDSTANFSRVLTADVPKLTYPGMFVDSADVVKYKFVKSNLSTSQSWSKHEKPTIPYDTPVGGEPGVYRYGWQKSVNDDGVIIYKMGYIADYNLKISAVYENSEVYFKILVPAAVIDGEHIDFVNVSIHGESYAANYWEPITYGGEKYYYAVSGAIYPDHADEVIEVRIPAEYGSGVNVNTTWSFTLSDYIEGVLATEAEGTWPAEQYATVKEIRDLYFGAPEQG